MFNLASQEIYTYYAKLSQFQGGHLILVSPIQYLKKVYVIFKISSPISQLWS